MKQLKNHKIFIGGIQGSGKTVLARYLVKKKFRRAIGVRVTPDFDDLDNVVLLARDRRMSYSAQLEQLAKPLVEIGERVDEGELTDHEYDVLIVDEADLAYRHNADLGEYFADLVAMHRHYKLAILFITRRPQDIPAKIRESSKHQFYFKIEGKNVKKYLGDAHEDLPEMVAALSFEKHDFIYRELGKTPMHHKPVPLV